MINMHLTLDSVLISSPDVFARIIPASIRKDKNEKERSQEAVLVIPAKGEVKVLNDVGAFIWPLVDGKKTVLNLVQEVCLQYDVDQDQAQEEILEFINDLVERGLLVIKK
jgi:hypothetical protein